MKTPETTLEEKVLNTISDRALIAPGDKIVVGLSGGPDSSALLHILAGLNNKMRWKLTAAHLNHGLRGAESDGDERFAKSLAEKLGVAFETEKIPPGKLAVARNRSPEEVARDARMAFLEKTRRRLDARLIALGHHRDDQVETVLLRLLRGASPRGLAGMDFLSGSIVRPLLNVTRDEILQYCRDKNIEYREDSSNRDTRFPRNLIRRELLPLIEEKLNPNARERIFHAARLLRRDNEFLESLAREWLEKCRKKEGDSIILRRGKLHGAPLPLLDRIWMAAIYEAAGEAGREMDSRHLMELTGRLIEGKRGEVSLPGGLAAHFTASRVEIGDEKSFRAPKQEKMEISIAPTALDGGKIAFGKHIFRFYQFDSPPREIRGGTEKVEHFDMKKMVGELKIRNWKRGDFFFPLGMNGKMKLSDFFINAKVEKERRLSVPLLCEGENIVWVVGMRMDERYKITDQTKRALKAVVEAPNVP